MPMNIVRHRSGKPKPALLLFTIIAFCLSSNAAVGIAVSISESPYVGPRIRMGKIYALQPEVGLQINDSVIALSAGVANIFYLPPLGRPVEHFVTAAFEWGRRQRRFGHVNYGSPANGIAYGLGYGMQYNFNRYFAVFADMRVSYFTDHYDTFEVSLRKTGLGAIITFPKEEK